MNDPKPNHNLTLKPYPKPNSKIKNMMLEVLPKN